MVSEPYQFERTREPPGTIAGAMSRFRDRLQTPVDGASLAVVRMLLGLMLAWEVIFRANIFFPPVTGFSFRYPYLEWLPDFPEMYIWFRGALVLCGLLLVAGIWPRIASFVAAFLVAYGFLLVPEQYLNHIYLFWIYLFLMAFVPSNRNFALRLPFGLSPRPGNVRYIHLFLLKVQTEIVLVYAGLVKINADWLALVPLRSWLMIMREKLWYGALLDYDWIVAAANYGVIALHVLGAPLLFFKKTRLPIFIVYCVFHLTNHHTFYIGIFPWLTIAASTLFFEPDWPRTLLRRIGIPLAGGSPPKAEAAPRWATAYTSFCMVWLVLQAIFPLRHYLYPGSVYWTDEGQRFSWAMMLTDRRSDVFWGIVHLPSKEQIVLIDFSKLLGPYYHKIATNPELTLQLAHTVARRFGAAGEDVQVHVYDLVSWNFRPPKLLIDPTANLVAKQYSIWPADWLIRQNDGTPARFEEYIKRKPEGLHPVDLVKAAGYPAYSDCREFRQQNQNPLVMCRKPVQR
jgi:vitamin K-dependent gamma-carboxylase